MTKMEKLILEGTANILNEYGFNADLETDMIFVDYGDAMISIQDNDIAVSFSVKCDPSDSAKIIKLVIEANADYKTYTIEIFEPFIDILDFNYNYIDTLWGEDAIDYTYKEENIISLN